MSPVLATSLGWTLSTTPPACSSSYTTYDTGAIGAPTGSTTYSYDEQGDLVGATVDTGDTGANADVQTTTASYNAMGNLQWSIPPAGQGGAQSSSNTYATSYAYVTGTSLSSDRYQPDGITTLYAYDKVGNLTSSANDGAPVWVATTTLYDGDNRPCYQLNEYGIFGSSCTAGSAQGSTSWTYEPGTTNVFQTTDSDSLVTTNYYDDLAYPNSPTEVAPADTNDQYGAYDDDGDACVTGDAAPTMGSTQCTSVPSGDTATSYDARGNELTVTDPSGNETTNSYENSSYPSLETRSINSIGAVTKYLYDADGELVTTVNPDGTGVTNNYNANGQVCNKTSTLLQYACGQGPSVAGATQFGYNDAGERTSMSDDTADPAYPDRWNVMTTYTYTNGELTSSTNGNGQTTSYLYNDAGEVACTAYPVSTSASCGTLSSPGTPSSSNTIVDDTYDALGRLASVSDWLGHTTAYGYANDSIPSTPTTITYPSSTGLSASYNYDNAGNLTGLTASTSSATPIIDTWSYDSGERVAVSTLNGAATGWTSYNNNNQIQYGTNLPTTTPGSDDAYGIAPNGEINGAWRAAGTTTSFGYNSGDELCWSTPVSESSNSCGAPSNTTVPVTTYGYNTNGERTSATTAAASTAGSITAVGTMTSGAGSGLSTLSVDPQSAGDALVLAVETPATATVTSVSGGGSTWQQIKGVTDTSDTELWLGTVSTPGYSTITVSYSSSVSSDWIDLDTQEFSYGEGSSTTWRVDMSGDVDDTSSHTSTVNFPSLSPAGTHELYVGIGFVGAGVADVGTAGTTSGVDYQLTWDSNVFAYDPNVSATLAPTATQSPSIGYVSVGALLTATGTVPATTTTNYDWNSYGQLCNVSTSGATGCGSTPASGTSYTYNGDGLRMTSSTGSSTTSSAWDTLGSIPLDTDDATTTSGSTTNVSYIYGDLLSGGTAPIEQITTTSSGSTAVFLTSNQTGVQGVFSSTGSTLELTNYSLYGVRTVVSGSNVTPFGFQGSYTDSTGLVYLVNRYYDPSTDQFLSIDPDVAATDQPYVFTNDDPLNAEDPLGEDPALLGNPNQYPDQTVPLTGTLSATTMPQQVGDFVVDVSGTVTYSGANRIGSADLSLDVGSGDLTLTVGSAHYTLSAYSGTSSVSFDVIVYTVERSGKIDKDKITVEVSAALTYDPPSPGIGFSAAKGWATLKPWLPVIFAPAIVVGCVVGAAESGGATIPGCRTLTTVRG